MSYAINFLLKSNGGGNCCNIPNKVFVAIDTIIVLGLFIIAYLSLRNIITQPLTPGKAILTIFAWVGAASIIAADMKMYNKASGLDEILSSQGDDDEDTPIC